MHVIEGFFVIIFWKIYCINYTKSMVFFMDVC